MRVDEQTILHVAEVARLKLSKREIERFLPEMKDIIEAVGAIEEVDTDGIKPSFQPIPLKEALREDLARPCFSQEEALSNSTQNTDGYFRGPKAV